MSELLPGRVDVHVTARRDEGDMEVVGLSAPFSGGKPAGRC